MHSNRLIRLENVLDSFYENPFVGPILMALFFMPQEYAIGAIAFKVWQYAQMIVFLISFITILLKKESSIRWLLLCGFYFLFYIVSSAINGAYAVLSSNIYECARGIAFISLCEHYYQRSPRELLRTIAIGGGLMCLLHVLSVAGVLLGVIPKFNPTPLGSYKIAGINYFFLTYDNESIFYLLPAIVALLLFGWGFSRQSLIAGICLLVITVTEFLILETVTGIASLLVFIFGIIVALIVMKHKGSRVQLPYTAIYLFLIVAAFVVCALIVVGVSSGVLARVAISMGKDGTFSGRSEIWNHAFSSILSHPLVGRGREGFEITTSVIGQTHVHNILLELLYTGGVATLGLYLGGVIACAVSLKDKRLDVVAFLVAMGGIAAFYLAAYMDWYPSIPVTIFLFYSPGLICRGAHHYRFCQIPMRPDDAKNAAR